MAQIKRMKKRKLLLKDKISQIKDELDNVILRLNIGKDMNYITKMEAKYL